MVFILRMKKVPHEVTDRTGVDIATYYDVTAGEDV